MTGDERDRSSSVPDRVIASALEFAVGVAAHGARQQPPVPSPPALRRFFTSARLAPKALGAVRSAIEGDPEFRALLVATVRPGNVDEAGMLWLRRPDGWVEQLLDLASLVVTDAPTAPTDAGRRADRRREQAEHAAREAAAEAAALRAQQARLVATAETATDRAARLEVELARSAAQVAALRDDVARLQGLLRAAAAEREELEDRMAATAARADEAEAVRDEVLAARVSRAALATDSLAAEVVLEGAALLATDLAAQAQVSDRVADELRRLSRQLRELEPARRTGTGTGTSGDTARRTRPRRHERRPVPLPGEVYGRTDLEATYLARHAGMQVVVDGYNVAKLAWPQLGLASQRDRCIGAAEDVARRYGTIVTVVFDGADVVGASVSARRLVTVVFSPQGVIADDVIRTTVDQFHDDVPVLVVTNDQALIADVRAMGANVLSSESFLGLSGR